MVEWSFPGDSGETLTAEIYSGEKKYCLRGFYAGNGMHKLRFLPQNAGLYLCNFHGPVEDSLTLPCEVSQRHGQVYAQETHFRYANGKWFYPFGTTVYALAYQPEDRLRETLQTLQAAPFNKIRMCVFPKSFPYCMEEPEFFPFEKENDGWNICKPCPAFWDRLDSIVTELNSLEIQVDLILMHPYDRWGFSRLNMEQIRKYISYAVSRLAAFPNIWWSLANEYDIMNYTQEDWQEMAAILSTQDPYHHLLSNHQMILPWDFADPHTTHICLQVKSVEDVSRYTAQYRKPLMVDECRYEGNLAWEWGNLSGFEMVNRFWKVLAQGGYASHGETFLDDHDILWWAKGGTLKGQSVPRIAFAKEIIERLPGPLSYCGLNITEEILDRMIADPADFLHNETFAPLAGKMSHQQAYAMLMDGKQFQASCGKDVFLFYYGEHCTGIAQLQLPRDECYRIECIDVWNMTRLCVAEAATGNLELHLPGVPGIALLASRIYEDKV